MRKDRIFILVVAIILANLALWTAKVIQEIQADPSNHNLWFALIADAVAVSGALWLLRGQVQAYKRAKRERTGDKRDNEHREV